MDRRERIPSLTIAVQSMIDRERADIWTAMPGIVQSVDFTKMTCVVQPAIQASVRDQQGNWNPVTLPVLTDCPICFPGGGGFEFTFPLVKGDEGILVFAARALDAWWQQGGVQPQVEVRMHDLSDGMFIPGLFSQPRIPANVSTTKAQLRSTDGATVIGIAPGEIDLVATTVKVTGALEVTSIHVTGTSQLGATQVAGALTATGDITAGQGTADQVGLRTHTHQYTTPAGGFAGPAGQTGAPKAGT